MRPDDQIEEKTSDCVQPETTIPIPEDLYSTKRSRMKSKYETIGGFFFTFIEHLRRFRKKMPSTRCVSYILN